TMESRVDSWAVAKQVTARIELGGSADLITQSQATVEPNSNSNIVVFDDYIQNNQVDEMLDVWLDDALKKKKKGKIKIRDANIVIPVDPIPPLEPSYRILNVDFDKNSGMSSFKMQISLEELDNKKIKSLSVATHVSGKKIIAIELEEDSGNNTDSGSIDEISTDNLNTGLPIVISETPLAVNVMQAYVQNEW
ncbi:MAG: hypothetical protein HKN22_03060, partial [Bacteroidia bacterium]|nr:hypothetical protein [Bacteroidia bacterium]